MIHFKEQRGGLQNHSRAYNNIIQQLSVQRQSGAIILGHTSSVCVVIEATVFFVLRTVVAVDS